MSATYRTFGYLIYLAGSLLAASALAAPRTEITPFIAYRFGGEFEEADSGNRLDVDDTSLGGLLVNVDWEANTQLEFLYSRQASRLRGGEKVASDLLFDLDIEYFHIGGTYLWPEKGIQPFVASGIGLTHLSPDFTGADSNTRLSMNIGGGAKWFPSKHLGVRFEARVYGTLINSGTAIFCGRGECRVRVSGDGFIQYETGLGVIFRF